jgi:hypothetical protein
MTSDAIEHRNVRGFEFPAFVGDDSDNAFALIFVGRDGERFMVSMPRTIAAAIAEHLTAALQQLAREGIPTETLAIPEQIVRYNARALRTQDGQAAVEMLLVGNRSARPFHSLQNQTDAKRLAYLILTAAGGEPAPAMKQ